MRHFAAFCLLLALSTAAWSQQADHRPTQYVDPFLGTGGHGHTYPGATVPFGMVQLSPDNGISGWDWCSGYHSSDSGIVGFSHTHLSGTGCSDLGDISFMPTTTDENLNENYRSPISHQQEFAEPGYYRVKLLDHNITVELTATSHVGMHKYTFGKSESARVLIDLKRGQDDEAIQTHLTVVSSELVTGYRFSNGWAADQRVFFAVRFSRPIVDARISSGTPRMFSNTTATGNNVKALLLFGRADDGLTLLAKVGISSVSENKALQNLDAEVPGWNFEAVHSAALDAWNAALSVVDITDAPEATKQVFYTALYHSFLAPTEFSDVDGKYRGADGKVHTMPKGEAYYSTYSLWDTYRAEHPMFTILAPGRVDGLMQSMLAFSHESGYLPVWQLAANETNCMVGYHAVPPLVDAYLKGFRGFNANDALQAMKNTATRDHRGLKYYSMAPPQAYLREKADKAKHAVVPTASTVVAGYVSSVAGDTIIYTSSHPAANNALITRASDGKQVVTWTTAPAPVTIGPDGVSFMWIAGLATAKGGHAFDLAVDGKKVATFKTANDPSETDWSVKGADGATLSFATDYSDNNNDHFGNMVLTLPPSACVPGKPVQLSVSTAAAASGDWYMTFRYPFAERIDARREYGVVEENGKKYQFINIETEHLGKPAKAVVTIDGTKAMETTIRPGYAMTFVKIPVVSKDKTIAVKVAEAGLGPWSKDVLVMPMQPLGYVPADRENESVSKSLEYAVDDYCIAALAKALGKKSDASVYSKRAQYYRNLFDPSTGFFRGRTYAGDWVSPFNPRYATSKQREYTEGNAWQYLWLVPHDVPGLISLLGGREKFGTQLDSLFFQSSDLTDTGAPPDVSGLIGLYAHGNEPSHHIAYLYDYCGTPWKTQSMVRRIMKEFYTTGREGLCGNEDCGQMSAWYVLSALGFYPVTPAGGVYVIGSPAIGRAVIHAQGGKLFTIEAKNNSPENVYVQSATLNGEILDHPWFTHKDILKGGTLTLMMGNTPNKQWGSAPEAMPPAMP